jgi:4-hydroxybenzoate polyprenyltransferase
MNRLPPVFSLLRPHQWTKSGFVFIGLLFGHAWTDQCLVWQATLAAAAFALAASAIYVLNDLADRERDRRHPTKCNRPLASGAVSVPLALVLCTGCLMAAAALAYAASNMVLLIVAGYVLLNIAYSYGLKKIVLLDVFIVSAGFLLRILAGTLGIGIVPTHWLLLCGMMLTLFLGFAKRRAELMVLGGRGGSHREVLDDYGPVLLDMLIGISAGGAIVGYSLYTLSADTIARHGTTSLVYTVPFVIYGMFRYLFLLYRSSGGSDPAATLLRDPHLLGAFGGWLLTVVLLLG